MVAFSSIGRLVGNKVRINATGRTVSKSTAYRLARNNKALKAHIAKHAGKRSGKAAVTSKAASRVNAARKGGAAARRNNAARTNLIGGKKKAASRGPQRPATKAARKAANKRRDDIFKSIEALEKRRSKLTGGNTKLRKSLSKSKQAQLSALDAEIRKLRGLLARTVRQ